MKTLFLSLTCLFVIIAATPTFGAAIPNKGLDWSNYDGEFSNPVTDPGESASEDLTFGSIIFPTTVDVSVIGSASVGDPIRANGGPAATQLDNGISLNSLFFKPDNTAGLGKTDYSFEVSGVAPLPAGGAIYIFSIAQVAGISTEVTFRAFDIFDNLLTSFVAMEIDMVGGSTFTASNSIATDPGYTALITNADGSGTTNTKPVSFIFSEDISRITFDISAVEIASGNYDGFNVGAALVPEPSTYLLMGSALLGVLLLARKRQKAKS